MDTWRGTGRIKDYLVVTKRDIVQSARNENVSW